MATLPNARLLLRVQLCCWLVHLLLSLGSGHANELFQSTSFIPRRVVFGWRIWTNSLATLRLPCQRQPHGVNAAHSWAA
jgi:hypothetical protein